MSGSAEITRHGVLTRTQGELALPSDNLVRVTVAAVDDPASLGLREAGDAAGPVMFGHFTPFDRWTEIDSFFEGNFMERTVKGAFKRTFKNNRDQMRALFQHGRDPGVHMKPLGSIGVLREEDFGPYYEVPLLDARYVTDDVLPGLRANLYGASYKFRVVHEEVRDDPGVSDYNPKGLPERTIREAQVFEFGPVTFPAYADATAGVRSGTDEYFLDGLALADPDCVRAVSDGSRFSVFIAHRLGLDRVLAERAQPEPESEPEAAEPAEPEGDAAAAERTDADEPASVEAREETPASDTTTRKETGSEPPRATTPLLGRRKEPWRL